MSALLIAIFAASVLGSFHCAGMCGAFLAVATGDLGSKGTGRPGLQAAYHIGRLVSYVSLGAAAGSAGRMLDVAGALAGIRPIAGALAGGAMIVLGVRALAGSGAFHLPWIRMPAAWGRVVQAAHQFALNREAVPRATMIGLLTTLLPCGWLYGFAITAAGTGSAWKGMLAMGVFWMGTLPALILVGAGIRNALGPIGKRLPALTCIALVAAGLYTLLGRAWIDPIALAGRINPSTTARSVTPPPPSDATCCEKP